MPPNARISLYLFARDGKMLACQEYGGPTPQLTLVDVLTGRRAKVAVTLKQPAASLAQLPGRENASTRSRREGSICWDASSKEIWAGKVGVGRALLSPDGKTLFTFPGRDSDPPRLWDAATGKNVGPKLPVLTFSVSDAATFTPDGRRLAVNTTQGVEVLDLGTGKILYRVPGGARQGHREAAVSGFVRAGTGGCLAFTPDGRTLLTCNGVLQAYDMASGKPLYPNSPHLGTLVRAGLAGLVAGWQAPGQRRYLRPQSVRMGRRHRQTRLPDPRAVPRDHQPGSGGSRLRLCLRRQGTGRCRVD